MNIDELTRYLPSSTEVNVMEEDPFFGEWVSLDELEFEIQRLKDQNDTRNKVLLLALFTILSLSINVTIFLLIK